MQKNEPPIVNNLSVVKKEKTAILVQMPVKGNKPPAKQPLTEQEKALVELLSQITINNIFKVPGK